jgi:DNA-binding NtrC family response regulator
MKLEQESIKMAIILIVEDSKVGKHYQQQIEARGHTAFWYRSGTEAEKELEAGLKYDMAIVDHSLESADSQSIGGEELISRMKNLYPDKPVICISGCYAINRADMLVLKPCLFGDTKGELERAIESALRKIRQQAKPKRKR